jgi:hypothetical protein
VGELFGAQLLLAEKTWAIALQKPGAARGPLPFTTGKEKCMKKKKNNASMLRAKIIDESLCLKQCPGSVINWPSGSGSGFVILNYGLADPDH